MNSFRDQTKFCSVLFVSAPNDFANPSSCGYPFTAYAPFQALLGFEAQIVAFSKYAEQSGYSIYYLPSPEFFSSDRAMSYLIRYHGDANKSQRVIHLRFGLARSARVLKNAVNIAVLAEDRLLQSFDLSMHPAARGDSLPAVTNGVFSYFPPRGNVLSIDGRVLPQTVLPDSLGPRWVDQGELPTVVPSSTIEDRVSQHLHMQSSGDFDLTFWQSGRGGSTPGLSKLLLDLTYARNLLNGGAHRERSPFIVIPWNLSHQGSFIPDLMTKLMRLGNFDGFPAVFLILPYNETASTLSELRRGLAACIGNNEMPGVGSHRIWLVRSLTAEGSAILGQISRVAWIDSSDPEWRWSMTRLRSLGIPALVLWCGGNMVDLPHDTPMVAADEPLFVESRDEFGRHSWRTRTVSVRTVEKLLSYAVTDIASQAKAQSPREYGPINRRFLDISFQRFSVS